MDFLNTPGQVPAADSGWLSRLGDRKTVLLIVLFSCLVSFFNHLYSTHVLFNDEAYELMIAEGVPLDRFYFMGPASAYPKGALAPIEMGPLYINRFLFWLFGDFFTERDDFLIPIHIFYAMTLALSCAAYFYALRSSVSREWAAIGSLMLASSYMTLLFNQFVSRNVMTILWGCLLMIYIPRLLHTSQKNMGQNLRTALMCSFLALAGAWTFTTYLLATTAIWAGLGLTWLRFNRKPSNLGWMVFSGGAFALTLLTFYLTDTFSMYDILFRGTYVVESGSNYAHHVLLTFLAPVYYATSGTFFTEDVYHLVGRQTLALPLGLCYFIGLCAALLSRRPALFLAAVTWIFAVFLCALGGPNPKYLYTFFPLILFIALFGVFVLWVFLGKLLGPIKSYVLVGLLLLSAVAIDFWYVWAWENSKDMDALNLHAKKGALRAVTIAESGAQTYLHFGSGYDILNWYLWPKETGGKVRCSPVVYGFPELFSQYPPGAGAVLLIDYPPEHIPRDLNGWVPPPQVKVVVMDLE